MSVRGGKGRTNRGQRVLLCRFPAYFIHWGGCFVEDGRGNPDIKVGKPEPGTGWKADLAKEVNV